ncbi:MAG: SPFH domain-containing protein, partial [Thermodesulfovibrionales bacterium]
MGFGDKKDVIDAEVVGSLKSKLSRGVRGVKIVGLLFVALIAFFILNPFVVIGAGERGVLLDFGAVQPTVYGEGLHLRVPIMQKIIKIDVRVHKSQVGAESVSK